MTSAEWHSTLFQFIGLLLSLATFIGSVVAIYYTYQNLKEMKKQMTSNQDIQEYYQSYYEINRLLDHVTQIIFKDISQILDTTGYKL